MPDTLSEIPTDGEPPAAGNPTHRFRIPIDTRILIIGGAAALAGWLAYHPGGAPTGVLVAAAITESLRRLTTPTPTRPRRGRRRRTRHRTTPRA